MDIVERLKSYPNAAKIEIEAADEITTLRAKLAEAERERDETFDNGPMGEEVNDILRAKLAELEKDCDAKDHVIQIQRTKLAEAERDAARYRYLRANCVQGRMESRGPNPDFALNCDEPESEWDAAIDAAMPSKSDPYAATRRAIVRAAAEIGKAMK